MSLGTVEQRSDWLGDGGLLAAVTKRWAVDVTRLELNQGAAEKKNTREDICNWSANVRTSTSHIALQQSVSHRHRVCPTPVEFSIACSQKRRDHETSHLPREFSFSAPIIAKNVNAQKTCFQQLHRSRTRPTMLSCG